MRFTLHQPGHQHQRKRDARQVDPSAVRQAAGGHHQHRHGQQQQLRSRQRRGRLLRLALGQDQEGKRSVQRHDRQQNAEGPTPGVQLGENAAHRRPHQGGDAPHRRDKRHGARPQSLLEHQVDHRVGERKDQPAAEALHRAADQHHRHARRQRAQRRPGDKEQRSHQIGAACAIAAEQPGRQRGAEDRRHHEQRGVPGIEIQPADILHHRGQNGGGDQNIDGMQRHAKRERDRTGRIFAGEKVTPAAIVMGYHGCRPVFRGMALSWS